MTTPPDPRSRSAAGASGVAAGTSLRPRGAKPGRPAKAAAEALSASLALRVTALERDRVQRQAERAGLPVSTYCRRVLLGHAVAPALSGTDTAALADLNRVGVNLNQIARQLNARGAARPVALDQLLDEMRAVVERLADGRA